MIRPQVYSFLQKKAGKWAATVYAVALSFPLFGYARLGQFSRTVAGDYCAGRNLAQHGFWGRHVWTEARTGAPWATMDGLDQQVRNHDFQGHGSPKMTSQNRGGVVYAALEKTTNNMRLLKEHARVWFRQVSPAHLTKRKHDAELAYWQSGLQNLKDWFLNGATLRIGLRPPTPEQTRNVSDSWIVNAVMTIHALRPHYTERLRIGRDHFRGQRVLEVGCGPLAPILQFLDCERHCVDPLIKVYMAAGWPLYEYDAKFINTGGESMPYRDGYFDSVISVNALDHVDDFEQTAREMERVVKPGGSLCFEVEYHEPTVTEPMQLDEARVRRAFSRCKLTPVINRRGRELYEALLSRFNLLPFDFQHFDGRFCTWRGTRK